MHIWIHNSKLSLAVVILANYIAPRSVGIYGQHHKIAATNNREW